MITAQNIKIRLAEDEDFEQIFSIWLEGIYNSFEDDNIDLDTVKKKFSSNFFQREGIFNFWVAVDEEDKVLGWQSLIKCISHPVKENIYAESSTYISKNIRSDGLGKLLLDFVIQEAEKSSLEYIIGFVSLTNEAARKITSQTGWIEIGIIPPSKKGSNKFQKIFMIRPV
ncbi:hypothetical protein A9P82_13590 [Arachidicoccus ginsenosidimutans]|uniref:GNAT family N-acetyltransferase n=1 Tax=Arachidicoccus sp. BS20 TaxID=1850526 RepID=UPI0007F0F67C|nr:GNAT family N-acetyltransferase [Arachidicoccus sp. BS20]ANI90231.1 hypothetical protein A9P82_13590 [Arachidicoccus sp. BS20]